MGWCWSEEIVERAKEELELLEAQHPNRFGFLKDQLRAFIAPPLLLSPPPASSASTQASTTTRAAGCRRKKKKKSRVRVLEKKHDDDDDDDDDDDEESVDLVLERARSCLAKIQHLKSLLKSHYPKSESVLNH